MTSGDQPPPRFDPMDPVRWAQRMIEELSLLPDAIAQWREGVAIFVNVARRMEAVTAAAEQIAEQVQASGVLEQLERLNRLGMEFTREVARGGATAGEQMLNEAVRNVAALTKLFAPRQPPPPEQD